MTLCPYLHRYFRNINISMVGKMAKAKMSNLTPTKRRKKEEIVLSSLAVKDCATFDGR